MQSIKNILLQALEHQLNVMLMPPDEYQYLKEVFTSPTQIYNTSGCIMLKSGTITQAKAHSALKKFIRFLDMEEVNSSWQISLEI